MSEKNLTAEASKNQSAIDSLAKRAGMKLSDCYQCGKCSAGCPMAESMDLMPRQVIRYLQLGLLDEALHSKAPWICAACHTCSARCPHEVAICELMEAVRQEAAKRGIKPVKDVALFTKDFMIPVKAFGRSHEMTMTAAYNLSSGHLLQNFAYVPEMLKGGKLKVFPEAVKDKRTVQKIFENCEKEAAKE